MLKTSGLQKVLVMLAFVGVVVFLKAPVFHSRPFSTLAKSSSELKLDRTPTAEARAIITPFENPIHGFGLQESWTRRYRFRRELKAQTPSQSLLDFDLRGTVTWNKLGEWVRGNFHLEASSDTPELQSTIPFYFKVSASGELVEVRSGAVAGDEKDQEAILKDLALIFAFRSNQDTAGPVEFELSEDRDFWRKRKIRYRGELQNQIRVLQSQHRVARDLSLLSGAETTQVQEVQTQSRYMLKLTALERSSPMDWDQKQISALSRVPLTLDRAPVESKVKLKWEDLAKDLDRIQNLNSQERMKQFHRIISALKSNPTLVVSLGEWAKEQRNLGLLGAQQFRFAVGVLSSVGSREAQSNLIRFFEDEPDPSLLNAFSLMRTAHTAEATEFLQRVAKNSRDPDQAFPALFALGNGLRSNPNNDAVIEMIQNRYQTSTSVAEKMELLDAMGNSGHERFYAVVEPILRNPSSPGLLVEKAIYSLRHSTADSAKTLLSSIANDERYARYRALIQSTLEQIQQR